MSLVLLTLALLTLGLLCVRPAQAQQDPGHYWKITYSALGRTSYAVPDIPADGKSTAYSDDWTDSWNYGLESETNINGNQSGTMIATLKWIPAAGLTFQSDPPPKPVFIMEQATAEESPANWNGSGPPPAPVGSASNGLGDPEVRWNSGYISSGIHLIEKDGSSGTITVSCLMSSVNPVSTYQTGGSGGYPGGGYPGGGGCGYWDWTGGLCEALFYVTVCPFGITADTNRDGVIDVKDELGKGAWAKDLGAIYNVNYERNGTNVSSTDPASPYYVVGMNAGVALPDAVYFNDDGSATDYVDTTTGHPARTILNATDAQNITPIVIQSTANFPADTHFFLKVATPAPADVSTKTPECQAFHLFKSITPGEKPIWGGISESASEVDITAYLSATQSTTFGIEGLLLKNDNLNGTQGGKNFGGYLLFTLEARENGTVFPGDTVMLKVAPWIMLPNTQPNAETWAVQEQNGLNQAFDLSLAGSGLKTVPFNFNANTYDPVAGSQWFQDHLEIGYTQRPKGPQSYLVFRLPYAHNGPSQPTWPLSYLVQGRTGATGSAVGVGAFQIGQNVAIDQGLPISGNYGGNLELLPPTAAHPLGSIVVGNTMSKALIQFLQAQEVQPLVPGINSLIPTDWLSVGHVDEVLAFGPGANQVIIADPSVAYTQMNSIPAASRAGAVFFAKGATLAGVFGANPYNPDGSLNIPGVQAGQSWKYVRVWSPGNPSVGYVDQISSVGNHSVSYDYVWYTSSRVLDGANNNGVCMANWMQHPSPDPKLYPYTLVPGDKYVLVEDAQKWNPGTPAIITVEEVLADAALQKLNTEIGTGFVADQIKSIKTILNTAANTTAAVNGTNLSTWSVSTAWVFDPDTEIVANNGDKISLAAGNGWAGGTYTVGNYQSAYNLGAQGVHNICLLYPAAGAPAAVSAQATGGVWAYGSTVPVSLAFTSVPTLYVGSLSFPNGQQFAHSESTEAFTPGLANVQMAGTSLYFPKQFGPQYNGTDIFEQAVVSLFPSPTFVDDWDLYHAWTGEVHCGTATKRQFYSFDWWTK